MDTAEQAGTGWRWTAGSAPDPPDESMAGTPARRPGSVRRTAHINMFWPGGFATQLQLRGRARDLATRADGTPEVLAQAQMVIGVGEQRTIEAVSVSPERSGAQDLVGARGGSRFRAAIDAALPGEREAATPLYFLLDDIAGATLIAGFAWCKVRPMFPAASSPTSGGSGAATAANARQGIGRNGRIICSGLRPGGYYEVSREAQHPLPHFLRRAGDLSAPQDPWAWHDIEPAPQVCMRRRRRIDAWRSDAGIEAELHFRDSLWDPSHVELAVHEYSVQATIDPASHRLLAITAQPRVLPFPECPWAAPHASELVGQDVSGFRTSVHDTLTELHACTHLNDMVRGLAEVPALVAAYGHRP